ncbi:AAA family ATPase [Microbispora sp. NBC_01389]|uniref:AAA family ATPase n=1 Tax=Microbispora sp. NBC_01389 TaxID=2903584 RepID=UPI003251DE2F
MSSGQPVLHRDFELDTIRGAISSLSAGQPAVIVIAGPRGVGKTTLLQAALTGRPDLGSALMARGHPAERDFPFGVVRQLFDPLIGGTANRPSVEPGALTLPGSGFGPPSAGLVAPDLLQSLYGATRSMTRAQPLIIAVDDVHCADPQSVQWCSYIARRLDGLPILMVLTVESDDLAGRDIIRDIDALPYAHVLRPAPLCPACARRLLETALGGPVDAGVADSCHRLVQGNPLLLCRHADRLAAAGVRPGEAELSQVLKIGAASMTETVAGWLADRDPASLNLLRSLAIVAPDDGLEIAAMLSGFGQLVAEEAGETLRRTGLLVGKPADCFAHPHVQHTILAGMDPADREDLHRRAASLLYRLGAPVNRSARHLMSAGATGDPWSVTVLREAAGEAAAEHSWDRATRYLHRALAESGDADAVLDVTGELGAVEMHRDLPACLRHLRTVAGRVRASPANLPAIAPFADVVVTANSSEASGIFADALQTAVEATPAGATNLMLILVAQILLSGPLGAVPRALRELGGSPAPVTSAAREFLSSLALVTGARGRNMNRTLTLARRCSNGKGVVPLGAVLPLIWSDRTDEASYLSERVVTEARTAGSDTRLVLSLLVRSEVRYQLGSLNGSLHDARDAIRYASDAHTDGFRVAAVASSARAHVELGELDAAESLLASVDPYGDWHPLISGYAMDCLGRLHLARGRARDGLRVLLECGRRLTSSGIANPACVPWGTNAVLAYVLFGERASARIVAEQELELAHAWGSPTTIARALSTGSVAYEGTTRLKMLHEAVDLLHNGASRLEYTRVLVRLGITLLQTGDDQKARDTLAAGLRLADDCGAVRLAGLAEKHLTATGTRSPRVRQDSEHPLTTGERRVTDLVLRGMSNLEVATALSISKRTVDTHLARIYRKLGIHSRAELAAILTALSSSGLPADDAEQRSEPPYAGPIEIQTVI